MFRLRKTMRKNGGRRLAVGLALTYVFFLLFPHFDAVTHVHTEDGRTHHHAFLSAHDVALERAALAAVPRAQGSPNAELAPTETSPPSSSSASSPSSSSSSSLAAGNTGEGGKIRAASHGRAHTHFQEDPNLPGLSPSPARELQVSSVPAEPAPAKAGVPALAIQASPARAPPRA